MVPLPIDTLFAVIIAYLFGSISSAIVVCKLFGLPDPRSQGSGNPGATNVLRIGGNKKAAVATLLGDLLKGTVPVLLAKAYGIDNSGLALVAFAAFIGHLFPVFFHFRGGKGVATALGCYLALAWPVGLALIATWLIIAMLFRYSSLASLFTALAAPFYMWALTNPIFTLMTCIISLILIFRHQANIRKLLQGKEDKMGSKKIKQRTAANEEIR